MARKRKKPASRVNVHVESKEVMVIETRDVPKELWAVFEGKEGENPRFCALFFNCEQAMAALNARTQEGELLFFDVDCVPALLTPKGIVFANDYTATTHAHLREEIKRYIREIQRIPLAMLEDMLILGK